MPQTEAITTRRVGQFMSTPPITVDLAATVLDAARLMRERGVSCVLVTDDGGLAGIVTTGDLVGRVLAAGLPNDTPVRQVMTAAPHGVDVNDSGHETLLQMTRLRVGHLPVLQGGQLTGIVTRSDLLAGQVGSAGSMVVEIGKARSVEAVASVVQGLPQLLVNLVGGNTRAEVATRLLTDVADAATRRFLELAEHELGDPPVPYLWLACGSQGRQEQTGVSDQDNCLFLDPAFEPAHDDYFRELAAWVTAALDRCGYVYCPGDMMASNPRWRQPLPVWESYFDEWVREPDKEAQMLASVMFDLRPIHGAFELFDGLHQRTMQRAQENSIFVAHMAAAVTGSPPPLGWLGGLSLIRSGEHKRHIDFKHSGVAPVVELARVYALQGALLPVNTRARLVAARDTGLISQAGAHDLIDAYDLFCQMRLEHQVRQIRQGEPPDNFVDPRDLSRLERKHLRDAFGVVRTMQAAALQGRGVLS